MRVSPHDVHEALVQAPGEQILELGDEIENLRKKLAKWDRITPARRAEAIRQIDYFVERAREIAPVVEMLHEVADQHELKRSDEDEDLTKPTAFMARQQPPFAAVLLHRLAAARKAGDLDKAANIRDDASTYARTSSILGVRDLLVDGLRWTPTRTARPNRATASRRSRMCVDRRCPAFPIELPVRSRNLANGCAPKV